MGKGRVHLFIDRYDLMRLQKEVAGSTENRLYGRELCGTGDAHAFRTSKEDSLRGEVTCASCLELVEQHPWLKERLPEPKPRKPIPRDDDDDRGPALIIRL